MHTTSKQVKKDRSDQWAIFIYQEIRLPWNKHFSRGSPENSQE